MRLGVDLGGTKIEIIALADDGQALFRQRLPTPSGDYLGTLAVIAHLVAAAEQVVGPCPAVGIGIPGSEACATGLIRNANSTCLNGRPLKHDLEALLGRAIRLANDANCFALSEAVDGSGQGAPVVFGAILGTGVGAGIVINGQVLTGTNGIAGEWGHTPLPMLSSEHWPLPVCYCGRLGCVETYLSGPGLARDHLLHTGQNLSPRAIDEAAEAGNLLCEATLQRFEARLGQALAGVINLLDPQVIVLGGGLSNMQRLYRNLPACCGPHVFSDVFNTRILPPFHQDSSGVRGAAWLWN